jgi:hypothetical protein
MGTLLCPPEKHMAPNNAYRKLGLSAVLALGICLAMPALSGAIITDTIFADGKDWAQPDLFVDGSNGLTWNDVSAVCPAGVCGGDWLVNGTVYDMDGWQWASVQDMNNLFNYYLGPGTFGTEPKELTGFNIAPVFFADGWRAIEQPTFPTPNDFNDLTGLTSTTRVDNPDVAHLAYVSRLDSSLVGDYYSTAAIDPKNGNTFGFVWSAWFYKTADVPAPSTLFLTFAGLLLILRWQGTTRDR